MFGTLAPAALAQEQDPSTPPSTSSTAPPSSTEPVPPSSEPVAPPSTPPTTPPSTPPSEPAPPSSTEPAPSTPEAPAVPEQRRADLEVVVPQPDLTIDAEFAQDEYLPESDIALRITVRNRGTAQADDVRIGTDLRDLWVKTGHERLNARPDIAPGATHVIDLVLRTDYPEVAQGRADVRATFAGAADPTPADNHDADEVIVRQDKGAVTGVLYRDHNGNGRADAGEGLGGAYLQIRGGRPTTSKYLDARNNGLFTDSALPAGRYVVERISHGEVLAVKAGHSEFVVNAGGTTTLEIPVVKPTSDTLTAQMTFDRASYARGDAVAITVTLTNTGSEPMGNVVAVCNPHANPGEIDGTGPGWAPLHPDGPGVALAAGETKTLTIPDVVPATSDHRLYASCAFGNNGRHTDGYRGYTATALVTGIVGDLTGTAVNAEDGTPLRNTVVVALDPATRRVLGATTTAFDGSWQIREVRTGPVVLVAVGPWRTEDGAPVTAEVLADQSVRADLRLVAGPQVPDPTLHAPDFEIKAEFLRPGYDLDDHIQAKVVVTNIGTGHSASLRMGSRSPGPGSHLDFSPEQWGDARNFGSGVELRPGESREFLITGRAPWYTPNSVVRFHPVVESQDANPANNGVEIEAPLTAARGTLSVLVYGDENENGKRDAGEEVAGAETALGRSGSVSEYPGKTGPDGRLVLANLVVGTYTTTIMPGDWLSAGPRTVTINENAVTEVEIRAVRPLSHFLKASVRFTQRTYAPGDAYEMDVELTNNTGEDIPAVHAFCSGPGGRGEIANIGPGWGGLAYEGPGVPVRDGETKRLRVSGQLPEEAGDIGFASAYCTFGPDLGEQGNPMGRDRVSVVGKFGDLHGILLHDEQPVTNTVVVLVDALTKKIVSRGISGWDGKFVVTHLPVGLYEPVVLGPWKPEIRTDLPYLWVTTTSHEWVQRVRLVPGPEVTDPGHPLPGDEPQPGQPAPPSGGGAGNGGGGGTALAQTGASVLGLGVVAVLLVAFGIGARAAARRRPA
ncbi:carboxypeptidase-like regulatory domain-containing protein [Lentzea guizhouensis]|uniref:carboxypeptidase-like regulatory domain-containing protein n=1 Tax=Lentzea guizhouensis TaxID=1586287 RepID=UPI0012B683EF|nr:carboxypeptidase-like regulatory domain-containing protein [Lentzea guizhouensis]